ncbi:MAG TPA: polysaccharide biosynthesis tyrosine autokinase, partial [Bacteroidetes bacterium]|nr:polysaccharide biosynthesis tyrosine autokinase [Bacteroidota bacterium]
LYIEKIFTEVEISSLQSKEKSYKILADDYKRKLLYDMPKRERHLYELVQNVETQRLNYQSLVNNNEKIQMVESEKVGNVQILMPASMPEAPTKQHQTVKMIIGALLGLIFGIGLSYMIEWQDVSLHTIEEVESRLNVPVLTAIPDFYTLKRGKPVSEKSGKESKKSQLEKSLADVYVYHYPYSPASESLRRLQTQLELLLPSENGKGHVILLTSAGPNEGKSTIAANLAVAMAQTDMHVVLIDADLRRPTLHKFFQVHRSDGLVDILSGDLRMKGLIRRAPEMKKRLELVTSGGKVTNPMAVLKSAKLSYFLNMLRNVYDYVIIDAPPLISFSDPLLLGKHTDGVILVIEAGKTQEAAAKRSLKMIQKVHIPFLGVVINKLNFKNEYGPYNYYNSYYKDYYREKERPAQPLIKNLSNLLQSEQKKIRKTHHEEN